MITKTFAAPTGAGIRKLVVAPAALGMGRRITVITPNNVVFNTNWSRVLPNATGIGPLQWLRRAVDADTDLIIVDCINAIMMERIRPTLERIRAEVWVVANGDEDLAPLSQHLGITGTVTRADSGRKLTADELRSAMAFNPADWAHGYSEPAPLVATSAWGVTKPRPSSIVSITQAELDQLLAPYIRYGLLRTIYTAATRATEYRGPSGKVIAISLRGNHYRNRDAVLGSTPSLHAQCIGRVRRAVSYDLVNPKTGEVVGGGTIPGNVTILHGSV